jgi:hypothetical protein
MCRWLAVVRRARGIKRFAALQPMRAVYHEPSRNSKCYIRSEYVTYLYRWFQVPRVEFEADTEEQLLALAWRWVMGPARVAGVSAQDPADQADLRRRQLGEVLNAIRGADSRRLLREVAELSTKNAALVLNAELAARYGKRTGTAFAGIVAGPNKVMRRVARRDLIIWDADARGYRMDPADAEIVLQRWPGT